MSIKKLLPLCFLTALFCIKGAESAELEGMSPLSSSFEEGLARITEICGESRSFGISFKEEFKGNFAEVKREAPVANKKGIDALESRVFFGAARLECELKGVHESFKTILGVAISLGEQYSELEKAYKVQNLELEEVKQKLDSILSGLVLVRDKVCQELNSFIYEE